MKRCITYCVYMASHTGLLTGTSICRFICVVQKHTRRQDAGGYAVCLFSLFSGLDANTAAAAADNWAALYFFNPIVVLEKKKPFLLHYGFSAWMNSRQIGRAAVLDCRVPQTPAKHLRVNPRVCVHLSPQHLGKFFGVRAEYLQLHFYPQQRRHDALTHNAPAGPVLKVVCNLFLRCT